MKVIRRLGRLRLRLDELEVSLLQTMLDELDTVLDEADGDDPVTARLFPSAYPDDERAEADYRSITEDSLRAERRERAATCAAELAAGSEVELTDPDVARRWIQVVNDLRLALGTRLGVSEDEPDIDPDDPKAQPWLVYYWLTALQDTVVNGLMGGGVQAG